MCLLWWTTWVSSMSFILLKADSTTSINSQPRALNIDEKQDISSYHPYQQQYPSGPYPLPTYIPPTYGPPPPPLPSGAVTIEFAFDEIVLRCVTEEPFEHVVWTRHQCPQQLLFGGEGIHVADGSTVHQDNLYDVHIRGHDGVIISELLIKHPLADNSEGIYQCEVWPHIHSGGGYSPFSPYQNYNPPRSEVFIIGGNSLLEECYRVSNFGSPGSKASGIANKQSLQNDKDAKFKDNSQTLKPRRNASEIRKDSNSKQLRYNLKYENNSLYNVDGSNVTAEFFRPSKNISFSINNITENMVNRSTGLKHSSNFFNSDIFAGAQGDKFKEIFPKFNSRKGKVSTNESDDSNQT